MPYDDLSAHVAALGGIERGETIDLVKIEAIIGARLPDALRWWLSTYGGGNRFREPVLYDHYDNVLGYFMTTAEILGAIDDYEGTMPPGAVPFMDDQCGGFLLVMPDGRIDQFVPDSPTEILSPESPSLEAFVLGLRRGE